MAVDATYIAAIAPEFASVDAGRLAIVMGIAALQVDQTFWGPVYDQALGYLTCHLLKIGDQKGKGQVTSQEIGDMKLSFASAGSGTSEFSQTSYGRTYRGLMRLRIAGPNVT